MYIVLKEFVFSLPLHCTSSVLYFRTFTVLSLSQGKCFLLAQNRDGVSSGLHPLCALVCAHTTCTRLSHACADVGIIRFCDMFAEKIECEIVVDKWFIILRSLFQNIVNYKDNSLTSKINIAFYLTYYL